MNKLLAIVASMTVSASAFAQTVPQTYPYPSVIFSPTLDCMTCGPLLSTTGPHTCDDGWTIVSLSQIGPLMCAKELKEPR